MAFVGRSGAGKTTALKLVNGMVAPTAGEVLLNDVSLSRMDLTALRRRTGYVIQGVGLFPHRTIYQNVATVPRLLGWSEEQIAAAATPLLESLGLPMQTWSSRFPRSLSGGEQQRVGIARAMVAQPEILLCDEPFAALDPIVRRDQQDALIALRKGAAPTIVFVTHDLREALRVAERVVLLELGRVALDLPAREFLHSGHELARRFIDSATLN